MCYHLSETSLSFSQIPNPNHRYHCKSSGGLHHGVETASQRFSRSASLSLFCICLSSELSSVSFTITLSSWSSFFHLPYRKNLERYVKKCYNWSGMKMVLALSITTMSLILYLHQSEGKKKVKVKKYFGLWFNSPFNPPRPHIDHPTSHLLQTQQTLNLLGISINFLLFSSIQPTLLYPPTVSTWNIETCFIHPPYKHEIMKHMCELDIFAFVLQMF